jgi:hypothetical protein
MRQLIQKTARITLRLFLLAGLLAGMLAVSGTQAARAASFTVTNLSDGGTGSLRQAIHDANATAGADTITFGVSGTITLAFTLPAINDDLTIDGVGQNITISGNNSVRVFELSSSITLALNAIIIANGKDTSGSGGGGMLSFGTLNVSNSTFSNNQAAGSSGSGGAIANNNGTLTITNSTFSGNSAASGDGGAIENTGTLNLANSTFSGNSAASGNGGAINNTGTLMMRNCTLSGNSALSGGGLYDASSSPTKAFNMIIANSTSGSDCVDAAPDHVFLTNSLLGNSCGTASPTNIISQNPLLGPLADNGGPTKTFALLPGSPAINAGAVSSTSVPIVLTTDQRGFTRISGGGEDIGAFEVQNLSCPAGKYYDGTNCVDATPGHYVPNPGATSQIDCALGTYQDGTGAISCKLADAGSFVATPAAIVQAQCVAGRYQPDPGKKQLS